MTILKVLKILKNNRHNFKKGNIPWNKGMKGIRLSNYGFEKGHIPPFKGKKVPFEIFLLFFKAAKLVALPDLNIN